LAILVSLWTVLPRNTDAVIEKPSVGAEELIRNIQGN